MLVRLALLFLLIVLAPLGLLCFGLPQTQGYGRLWTSTSAVTLFVQFFQVVTLALGGMLISSTQTTSLLKLDTGVVSLLVSTAVMYLVLCIPGMIRNWALRPVAQAGLASAEIAGSRWIGVGSRYSAAQEENRLARDSRCSHRSRKDLLR